MRRLRVLRISAVVATLTTVACTEVAQEVAGPPGTPLPGLSASALERFEKGRRLFEHGWTPEEGLGPTYVQDRCTSCHDVPSSGGSSPEGLMKFASGCDPLASLGGDILQLQQTPLYREHGSGPEYFPSEADTRVTLLPSMLYGLGLIEAVSEEDLRALADPEDVDGDGISGRVGRAEDGRLARLGRKASTASIVDLVDAALITEIGLTTPSYPTEETVNGRPVPPESDPVPDPEVDSETIALIADFVRFLAPLARENPASDAVRDSLERGEEVFEGIGCGTCHVRSLTTGDNDEPALDHKAIRLYSDLLLHDMGPRLADLCGPGAQASELRTEKLMGLRYRIGFMHDGRASGIDQAIVYHDGEGAASRDAYMSLTGSNRAYLLRFLISL